MYLDRLPFILPANKLRLEHLVAFICGNISENSHVNETSSDDQKICLETSDSVCVQALTLTCSDDFFVRTSRSQLSFSPEMFHHGYIVRTIGYSLIDRNCSRSVSKP